MTLIDLKIDSLTAFFIDFLNLIQELKKSQFTFY